MKKKIGQFIDSIKKAIVPVMITVAVLYGIGIVGYFNAPEKVRAVETIVTVPDNSIPPILEKIIKCESGGKHFDKNGQVLINKTQDIGLAQINVPIWGKKAHEMGLNLADEKDNLAFALWLFKNYGSEPWSASKHGCWSK